MKVYAITADTYKFGYGSEVELFGVSDNEEGRDKIVKYVKEKGYDPSVDEIEMNVPVQVYLGGYVE